jgi:peptide/nickel transport system permease protein
MTFLFKRLVRAALLLVGVSLLSFLFASLAPGSYFDEMRLNPQISPQTVQSLRAQYGLTASWPVRYGRWLKSVSRADLGFSFAYNSPAAPLLLVRMRNTLLLTSVATLLAWLLALPLGVWSASHLGRPTDHAIGALTSFLLVLPDVLLALALLFLALKTSWLPTGGMVSPGYPALSFFAKVGDLARHMALPVVALVLATLPTLVRHIRAAVADVLDAGFIRAAQAHGVPRRRLLFGYALRAAANPLVSLFGFSLGALLSGSLLIEVIMSWPGLGPLLLEAILARDIYLVIGGVMMSTVFLVGGNVVADLLLYWLDPRIRTARVQG